MTFNVFPSPARLPTRLNYLKLKEHLSPIPTNALIYLRGGTIKRRDDTDIELDFRQEILPVEQLWKGKPDTNTELLDKYDADFILTEEQIEEFIIDTKPNVIYTLDTSDAGYIPERYRNKIDAIRLRAAINESRLTKLPWEISMIRYATHISSHAHMALMSLCSSRRKEIIYEQELEAKFRWVCSRNGLNRQCYIPIIASGPRASVLHYTDNDKIIPGGPHALVLVDAGGEYKCYGSDVTRTFPVSGVFSNEAKTIYNIVLKAQNAVLERIKPGVYWRDMHSLVVRTLCHELVQIGLLVGKEEELIKIGVYRAFYFHGTGHSVGLDCHDVGGQRLGIFEHPEPAESELDLNRALEENMVVTVEPGIYFHSVSIDMWANNRNYAHYFNMKKINQYRSVGGVRIEDTILITADGHENFTIVPKEVQDIEALMKL
ncbi:peptidase M24, structural domain-containing protein [Helicostylum pulchrum]|nr:peptidase M24, structural domain-containing protein [Helicostylum pulchrum]